MKIFIDMLFKIFEGVDMFFLGFGFLDIERFFYYCIMWVGFKWLV